MLISKNSNIKMNVLVTVYQSDNFFLSVLFSFLHEEDISKLMELLIF